MWVGMRGRPINHENEQQFVGKLSVQSFSNNENISFVGSRISTKSQYLKRSDFSFIYLLVLCGPFFRPGQPRLVVKGVETCVYLDDSASMRGGAVNSNLTRGRAALSAIADRLKCASLATAETNKQKQNKDGATQYQYSYGSREQPANYSMIWNSLFICVQNQIT